MPLLLLIPFAVVVVVLSFLGFAGIGPLSEARRADRGGGARVVGPAVGLLLGVVVLVGAVSGSILLIGVGGRDGDGVDGDRARGTVPPSTRSVAASAPASTGTTTVTTRPLARGTPRPVGLGPVVAIEADGAGTFPRSYDVADALDPSAVLRVHASGFVPYARGTARQCVDGVPNRCANAVPVQFDAAGTAEFQYLVTDEFLAPRPVPGGCRVDAARCSVVVRSAAGGRHGEIQTVFGDTVPVAGHIDVTPATGLSLDGETVTVAVRDYPPGARLTAMLCAAPDATGTRCGAPGPTEPLVVRPDGTGRARLELEPGRVGAERVPCFRGDDCGVSVASATVFARAPVVPISFAAPPGAAYDTNRLALGLAIAVLLLAVAAILVRRTDWSAVGEAAAPEIDDARYADLDAIIAALPPVDDESVPAR